MSSAEDRALRKLTAVRVVSAVRDGELTSAEVVEAHVRGLDELAALNAVITPCPDAALERARGRLEGPLAGVPVLIKDLFDTAGLRTTYGSPIYADHVPARNAVAVDILERAGAVVIGKANLHEFAWGTTSQNPHFGYVGNPVAPGHVAGGSSGGNAAALAADVSALGLGSDTAGSVRIPSACCGTVGFKPASGTVSTEGCRHLSPTFDVPGPMARTVADCALAYSVLSGTPVPRPRLRNLVVGVLEHPALFSTREPGAAAISQISELGNRLQILEELGAVLVPAELPVPLTDLVPIMLHEASLEHRDTFPSQRARYGPDTQRKWDAAGKVTAEEAAVARRELSAWRERARTAARAIDVYVCPTLAGPIPKLTVWEPDVRVAMIGNTRAFSFLGWPAIAFGDMQFAGPETNTVLAAALAWENAGAGIAAASPA
jgi:aspartyl-tRNA(Asn)/glutamyl-tRNA(Gln) amidotransferase subunit A